MSVEEAAALFVPHVLERRATFAKGKRLVHYTTAEALRAEAGSARLTEQINATAAFQQSNWRKN